MGSMDRYGAPHGGLRPLVLRYKDGHKTHSLTQLPAEILDLYFSHLISVRTQTLSAHCTVILKIDVQASAFPTFCVCQSLGLNHLGPDPRTVFHGETFYLEELSSLAVAT